MRKIQPIVEGRYYHIFNRGIDGINIFQDRKDYHFFLDKLEKHLKNTASLISYCLLKNHFHLLVFVKENVTEKSRYGNTEIKLDFSKQIGHFFNSYAQVFNRANHRSGSLFVSPFRRKLIESELYISSVIFYIHANAQHHGYANDFREWPYSSYQQIADGNSSLINLKWIFEWFGSRENFLKFHDSNKVLPEEREWVLEK
jgi:putative transposase